VFVAPEFLDLPELLDAPKRPSRGHPYAGPGASAAAGNPRIKTGISSRLT